VLLGLADAWGSPLNNRLNPVFYALYPLRPKIKDLLHGLAHGTLPLSKLEQEVQVFPLLDRTFAPISGTQTTRDFLMSDIVYPIVRDWGVVFGGANTKTPDVCPADNLATKIEAAMGVDAAAQQREKSKRRLLSSIGGGAQTTWAWVSDDLGSALVCGATSGAKGLQHAATRVGAWLGDGGSKALRALRLKRRRLGQAKLRWDLQMMWNGTAFANAQGPVASGGAAYKLAALK